MIGMRAGRIFFDTAEIKDHLDAAEIKIFSRFGAYVMTTARGLMKKPNKKGDSSKPGKPPKSRKGYVKSGAFAVQFAWDSVSHSLVVGPLLFPALKHRTSEGTNVETLEKGGTIHFQEGHKKDGTWSFHAALWAKVNGAATRESSAAFAARPFMAPAYEKNQPKLAQMWANALSK